MRTRYWRGQYNLAHQTFSIWPSSLECKRNSNLQSLAGRYLGDIENALRQTPSNNYLWVGWVAMHHMDGASTLKKLLPTIHPDPLHNPSSFPPRFVIDDFVSECREKAAWKEMEEVLSVQWDKVKNETIKRAKRKEPAKAVAFPSSDWETFRLPVAEALLQQGRQEDADSLVHSWVMDGGKMGNIESLCKIAELLAFNSLATSWRNSFSTTAQSPVKGN